MFLKTVSAALWVSVILLPSQADAKPKTSLPFVGVRSFSFDGGNAVEEAIVIKANGQSIVTRNYTDSGKAAVTLYQGPFTNPIPIQGGKYYYEVYGNAVKRLDSSRRLMRNCPDMRGHLKACEEAFGE